MSDALDAAGRLPGHDPAAVAAVFEARWVWFNVLAGDVRRRLRVPHPGALVLYGQTSA